MRSLQMLSPKQHCWLTLATCCLALCDTNPQMTLLPHPRLVHVQQVVAHMLTYFTGHYTMQAALVITGDKLTV